MAAVTERGLQIQKKQRTFPWFLLATLLPILAMPFSNLEGNPLQRLILPLAANLLLLQSLRIMPARNKHPWRLVLASDDQEILLICPDPIYRLLGLLSAVAMWLPFVTGHHSHSAWHAWVLAVICAFYLLTTVRVVQLLSQLEGVNLRSLCLGCAGYVHLGLTAGQIATFIQVVAPKSFSLGSMLPGEELVERLTYFSFVTLGSIGYGDVVPNTPTAEFFSVCIGIIGTLYVSLIIGLLLSRYINDRTASMEKTIEQEIRNARD
jgi:hypothetical protein